MNRRAFLELLGLIKYVPLLSIERGFEMPIQQYSGDYFLKLIKDLSHNTGVSLPQAELDTLQRLVDEERQREEAVKAWMRVQDDKIGMNFLDLPIFPIYSQSINVNSPSINIPIPGNYKHLFMFSYAKTDRASTSDWANGRFNDDTGNNYMEGFIGESVGVSFGSETTSRSSFIVCFASAASSSANVVGSSVLFIPNYNSSSYKNVLKMTGYGDSNTALHVANSVWKNTSPISKLTILPESGTNIVAGSIFSLYGIK